MVSPVTVIGEEGPVATILSGFEVTVKPVMFALLLLLGEVKLTVTWPLPAVAVPIVGISGIEVEPNCIVGVIVCIELTEEAPGTTATLVAGALPTKVPL